MNHILHTLGRGAAVLAAVLLLAGAGAQAHIVGVTGTSFSLTAKADHLSTGEGGSVYFWGYALNSGRAQYPGPTLIVNQNAIVTVTLKNALPAGSGNVSIVFPGQIVNAAGGTAGRLTQEAPPDGVTTVTYTFTANRPGTYIYHSGTQHELQVEMGLAGVLIVRPTGYVQGDPATWRAYDDPVSEYDSSFGHEWLFVISEMDSRIHDLVEFYGPSGLTGTDYLTNYFSNYYFLNGRTAPDTMLGNFVPWLPTQPYSALPQMHPGDKLLVRMATIGRDFHPFHTHGNHTRVIARDGQLLESVPGVSGPDITPEMFTIPAVPGETVDGLYTWTGKGLNWDIYGTGPGYEHDCVDNDGDGYDDDTLEWCADHGKPFPVVLPENQNLTFGAFYSGSPFLGTMGALPPGEGGLNPYAGYTYMWHSHTEKELINYGIFPGGMLTMLIIQPHGVPVE